MWPAVSATLWIYSDVSFPKRCRTGHILVYFARIRSIFSDGWVRLAHREKKPEASPREPPTPDPDP